MLPPSCSALKCECVSASVCLARNQVHLPSQALHSFPVTERRGGRAVQPAEHEPAVLRRHPGTSLRLPILPHATTSTATKLCYHFYGPAALHRGLLRLGPSHLPAGPAGPTLSPGICTAACTCCAGRCGLSFPTLPLMACGPLASVTCPVVLFMLIVTGANMFFQLHQTGSPGAQKVSQTNLTEILTWR